MHFCQTVTSQCDVELWETEREKWKDGYFEKTQQYGEF